MIEVLSKSADRIGIRDIEALIASKVPEGEQIEFKEALPARGRASDPWMTGKDQIGDRAKNTILDEVVAFANAYGGALLLGIGESDTKPAVASKISPIPRCAELAERLKLVFRDCVEPQLPRIEVFAVRKEDDSGVVVIRVGRSRQAPHRVTKTLVCPIRRSDRCEKMTMREIQDMTLNVSRGLKRLEKRFSERSKRFPQEFACLETPENAYGVRMTAAPVGDDIRFERVFRGGRIVEELNEPWRKILYGRGDNKHSLDDHDIAPIHWRPRLRAARAELAPDPLGSNRIDNSYMEIHCDGLIELGFVSTRRESPFPSDIIIALFANLIVWADNTRNKASSPAAEYALEADIRAKESPVSVLSFNSRTYTIAAPLPFSELGILQPYSPILLPRYSLGDPDEIPQLLTLFYRDFCNSLGGDTDIEEGMFAIENWPKQG